MMVYQRMPDWCQRSRDEVPPLEIAPKALPKGQQPRSRNKTHRYPPTSTFPNTRRHLILINRRLLAPGFDLALVCHQRGLMHQRHNPPFTALPTLSMHEPRLAILYDPLHLVWCPLPQGDLVPRRRPMTHARIPMQDHSLADSNPSKGPASTDLLRSQLSKRRPLPRLRNPNRRL